MNIVLLPIVLVLSFWEYPEMPPVHVERFETESECKAALIVLDKSTPVTIILQCLVDES